MPETERMKSKSLSRGQGPTLDQMILPVPRQQMRNPTKEKIYSAYLFTDQEKVTPPKDKSKDYSGDYND